MIPLPRAVPRLIIPRAVPTVTRVLLGLLSVTLTFALGALARGDDAPAFTSARAKEAVADRATALQKADDELATKVKDARGTFLKRLDIAIKAVMKDGDLDEANRINALKKSFDGELDTKDEVAALKSTHVKDARTQYETTVQKAHDEHTKKVTDASKTCVRKLDGALKEAMHKGDLDEAKRIDAEKKATEDELASNELKRDAGWLVLFRSNDPAIWNTESTTQGESSFALPLSKAPRLTCWVRLRRMDTKEFAILAVTKAKLGALATDGDLAWEGSCQFAQGGRHLGIDKKAWHCTVEDGGRIMVTHDRGNRGWGFGHKVHVNDKQYWSWAGEEIPQTAFEISAKAEALTKAEAESVVK
jgi:hypothetical protein